MEEAQKFVLRYILPELKNRDDEVFKDYKTALQEYAQQYKLVLEYEFVSKTGPEHKPEFCYISRINGQKVGEGKGKNKAEAQYQAAKSAYEILKNRGLEN